MNINAARWLLKSMETYINTDNDLSLKFHLKNNNIKTDIDKNEIIKIFDLIYEEQQFSISMQGFCIDFLDFQIEGPITQIIALALYQAKILRVDKCVICDSYIIKWTKRKSVTCSPTCRKIKQRSKKL